MDRIEKVNSSLKKTNRIVGDSVTWLSFEDFFPIEIEDLRKHIRKQLESQINSFILEDIEHARFPERVIPLFKELNIGYHYMGQPFGKGKCLKSLFAIILELSRIDASVGTVYLVNYILFGNTIDDYGSEEQRKYFMPKLLKCEIFGGWGLTEPNYGSDASGLQTSCERLSEDEWVINGHKRWIGNGDRDYIIVFARDKKDNKVKGFIVDLTLKGIERKAITHKLPLRAVQNMDIKFQSVIINETMRLPKVNGFETVTNMLAHSRISVAMMACGLAVGVYDNTIKYLNNRKQFGKKILGFQITQEKLVRMMGNIQASLLVTAQMVNLIAEHKISIGKLALAKSWVTLKTREVCALGRELLGGNGIITDNYVMKAFVDIEAIYTFEGTYDINSLVAGRELTGLSAFK